MVSEQVSLLLSMPSVGIHDVLKGIRAVQINNSQAEIPLPLLSSFITYKPRYATYFIRMLQHSYEVNISKVLYYMRTTNKFYRTLLRVNCTC